MGGGGLIEGRSFDLGTMHIFLFWFPLIGRCIGEFRHSIGVDRKYWSKQSNLEQKLALRSITKATFEILLFFLFIIVITAIVVPLLTKQLDDNMASMVQAFSRLLSGIILGMLSIRVACWLDVYYKLLPIYDLLSLHKLGTSIKELKFNVRWEVSKKILRLYYSFLILFQGVNFIAIPASIIAGVVAGLSIDYLIYKLRRLSNEKHKYYACLALVLILMLGSIAELAESLWYIQEVWFPPEEDGCDGDRLTLPDIGLIILIPLFPIIHFVYWYVGKTYKEREDELLRLQQQQESSSNNISNNDNDKNGNNNNNNNNNGGTGTGTGIPIRTPRQRMVYSIFISEQRVIEEIKNASLVSEAEAAEAEAVAVAVAAAMGMGATTRTTSTSDDVGGNDDGGGGGGGVSDDEKIIMEYAPEEEEAADDDDDDDDVEADVEAGRESSSLKSKEEKEDGDAAVSSSITENNDAAVEMTVIAEEGEGEEEGDDDNSEKGNEKEEEEEGDDDDDHIYKSTSIEEMDNTTTGKEEKTIPKTTPTYMELLMDWKFCGCVRQNDKTSFEKTKDVIVWIFYSIFVALCIFSCINNILATQQQTQSKCKLPFVADTLYHGMDDREVCAFNNNTADWSIPRREWKEQPITFPNKSSAHLAGYSVLHCGACSHCSDWVNLELEYTTRKFLAEASRDCALQSLFGSDDDMENCLKGPTVGFQGQCATCWAEDIICTKDFCKFIGIQSFFINTLGNFEVGPNTITAATCEEANCEAGNPGHFVSCSGATRRRMGVKSTIERPTDEQCNIVDVDWDVMFPDVHPYESYYVKPTSSCNNPEALQEKAPIQKAEVSSTFECNSCNRLNNFTDAEEESLSNSGQCR